MATVNYEQLSRSCVHRLLAIQPQLYLQVLLEALIPQENMQTSAQVFHGNFSNGMSGAMD